MDSCKAKLITCCLPHLITASTLPCKKKCFYIIYTTMTKLLHAKLSYEKLISKAITVRFEFNLHL